MPEEDKKSIMNATIDLKWLITLLIPFIAWCVSLEVRMSSGLSQRVTNLEVALQPVLIDYGVDKELEARGIKVATLLPSPTVPTLSPAAPAAATLGPTVPNIGTKLTKEDERKAFRKIEEAKLREQFPNAYAK